MGHQPADVVSTLNDCPWRGAGAVDTWEEAEAVKAVKALEALEVADKGALK